MQAEKVEMCMRDRYEALWNVFNFTVPSTNTGQNISMYILDLVHSKHKMFSENDI